MGRGWPEEGKGGDKTQTPHRVKPGCEGVVDSWEGRKVALRRVFCGVFICLVFKIRAPWGAGRGRRKDKILGIQQILAELTNSCYASLSKMLRSKLTNDSFPAEIDSESETRQKWHSFLLSGAPRVLRGRYWTA